MYPPQLSFIPVTVALVKFIEVNGFDGLYPYWYLGSTPVKYLTGPVVPGVLVGLHKLLADFSLFDLSYVIILTLYLIFSVGWGVFAAKLSGSRMVGWWVGIFSLVLPWHLFSSLAFGEVSAVLAAALTPWVLWMFARGPVSRFPPVSAHKTFVDVGIVKIFTVFKKKFLLRAVGNPSTDATPREAEFTLIRQLREKGHVFDWCQVYALPSLTLALLLLTNTTASIPAIVGLLILGIIATKHWNEGLKKVFIVIAAGWLLALWWYGMGYWWTTLLAPSIGGRSAVSAFVSLLNLLRGFVPVILAVILVWWKIRPKNIFEKFTLIWLTTFGSLTLFRFMADPDFWLDWTAWMGEIEVGIALSISGILSQSLVFKKRSTNLDSMFESQNPSRSSLRQHHILRENSKVTGSWLRHVSEYFETAPQVRVLILIIIAYFVAGWGLAWQNRDFWLPRKDISQSVEYRIAESLGDNVGVDETVFLSGTTAFWLNSLVDVRQVRGGRDEAALHASWREAVWEIRQGTSGEDTERVLRALAIDYVVVHTQDSAEFYHDFENSGKFDKIGTLAKIYEDDGDVIFKVLSNGETGK